MHELNLWPDMQTSISFMPRANSVNTVKGAEHVHSLPDSIADSPESLFETLVGPPIMHCNELSTPLTANDLLSTALQT